MVECEKCVRFQNSRLWSSFKRCSSFVQPSCRINLVRMCNAIVVPSAHKSTCTKMCSRCSIISIDPVDAESIFKIGCSICSLDVSALTCPPVFHTIPLINRWLWHINIMLECKYCSQVNMHAWFNILTPLTTSTLSCHKTVLLLKHWPADRGVRLENVWFWRATGTVFTTNSSIMSAVALGYLKTWKK